MPPTPRRTDPYTGYVIDPVTGQVELPDEPLFSGVYAPPAAGARAEDIYRHFPGLVYAQATGRSIYASATAPAYGDQPAQSPGVFDHIMNALNWYGGYAESTYNTPLPGINLTAVEGMTSSSAIASGAQMYQDFAIANMLGIAPTAPGGGNILDYAFRNTQAGIQGIGAKQQARDSATYGMNENQAYEFAMAPRAAMSFEEPKFTAMLLPNPNAGRPLTTSQAYEYQANWILDRERDTRAMLEQADTFLTLANPQNPIDYSQRQDVQALLKTLGIPTPDQVDAQYAAWQAANPGPAGSFSNPLTGQTQTYGQAFDPNLGYMAFSPNTRNALLSTLSTPALLTNLSDPAEYRQMYGTPAFYDMLGKARMVDAMTRQQGINYIQDMGIPLLPQVMWDMALSADTFVGPLTEMMGLQGKSMRLMNQLGLVTEHRGSLDEAAQAMRAGLAGDTTFTWTDRRVRDVANYGKQIQRGGQYVIGMGMGAFMGGSMLYGATDEEQSASNRTLQGVMGGFFATSTLMGIGGNVGRAAQWLGDPSAQDSGIMRLLRNVMGGERGAPDLSAFGDPSRPDFARTLAGQANQSLNNIRALWGLGQDATIDQQLLGQASRTFAAINALSPEEFPRYGLDIETTVGSGDIFQVAAKNWYTGETKSWLINPGEDANYGAPHTGPADEWSANYRLFQEAVAHGMSREQAAVEMQKFLGPQAVIYGHNLAGFDLPQLQQQLGMDTGNYIPVDTYGLAIIGGVQNPSAVDAKGRGGQTLGDLYSYLTGNPLTGAHDASVDVGANLDIAEYLAPRAADVLAGFTDPSRVASRPRSFTDLVGIDAARARNLNEQLYLNDNFPALMQTPDAELMRVLGYSASQVADLKASAKLQFNTQLPPVQARNFNPIAAPNTLTDFLRQATRSFTNNDQLDALHEYFPRQSTQDTLATIQSGQGFANLAQYWAAFGNNLDPQAVQAIAGQEGAFLASKGLTTTQEQIGFYDFRAEQEIKNRIRQFAPQLSSAQVESSYLYLTDQYQGYSPSYLQTILPAFDAGNARSFWTDVTLNAGYTGGRQGPRPNPRLTTANYLQELAGATNLQNVTPETLTDLLYAASGISERAVELKQANARQRNEFQSWLNTTLDPEEVNALTWAAPDLPLREQPLFARQLGLNVNQYDPATIAQQSGSAPGSRLTLRQPRSTSIEPTIVDMLYRQQGQDYSAHLFARRTDTADSFLTALEENTNLTPVQQWAYQTAANMLLTQGDNARELLRLPIDPNDPQQLDKILALNELAPASGIVLDLQHTRSAATPAIGDMAAGMELQIPVSYRDSVNPALTSAVTRPETVSNIQLQLMAGQQALGRGVTIPGLSTEQQLNAYRTNSSINLNSGMPPTQDVILQALQAINSGRGDLPFPKDWGTVIVSSGSFPRTWQDLLGAYTENRVLSNNGPAHAGHPVDTAAFVRQATQQAGMTLQNTPSGWQATAIQPNATANTLFDDFTQRLGGPTTLLDPVRAAARSAESDLTSANRQLPVDFQARQILLDVFNTGQPAAGLAITHAERYSPDVLRRADEMMQESRQQPGGTAIPYFLNWDAATAGARGTTIPIQRGAPEVGQGGRINPFGTAAYRSAAYRIDAELNQIETQQTRIFALGDQRGDVAGREVFPAPAGSMFTAPPRYDPVARQYNAPIGLTVTRQEQFLPEGVDYNVSNLQTRYQTAEFPGEWLTGSRDVRVSYQSGRPDYSLQPGAQVPVGSQSPFMLTREGALLPKSDLMYQTANTASVTDIQRQGLLTSLLDALQGGNRGEYQAAGRDATTFNIATAKTDLSQLYDYAANEGLTVVPRRLLGRGGFEYDVRPRLESDPASFADALTQFDAAATGMTQLLGRAGNWLDANWQRTRDQLPPIGRRRTTDWQNPQVPVTRDLGPQGIDPSTLPYSALSDFPAPAPPTRYTPDDYVYIRADDESIRVNPKTGALTILDQGPRAGDRRLGPGSYTTNWRNQAGVYLFDDPAAAIGGPRPNQRNYYEPYEPYDTIGPLTEYDAARRSEGANFDTEPGAMLADPATGNDRGPGRSRYAGSDWTSLTLGEAWGEPYRNERPLPDQPHQIVRVPRAELDRILTANYGDRYAPIEIAPGITRVGPNPQALATDFNNETRTTFDLSIPAGVYQTDAPLRPVANPQPVRAVQRTRMGYGGDPEALGAFIDDTKLQTNLGVYLGGDATTQTAPTFQRLIDLNDWQARFRAAQALDDPAVRQATIGNLRAELQYAGSMGATSINVAGLNPDILARTQLPTNDPNYLKLPTFSDLLQSTYEYGGPPQRTAAEHVAERRGIVNNARRRGETRDVMNFNPMFDDDELAARAAADAQRATAELTASMISTMPSRARQLIGQRAIFNGETVTITGIPTPSLYAETLDVAGSPRTRAPGVERVPGSANVAPTRMVSSDTSPTLGVTIEDNLGQRRTVGIHDLYYLPDGTVADDVPVYESWPSNEEFQDQLTSARTRIAAVTEQIGQTAAARFDATEAAWSAADAAAARARGDANRTEKIASNQRWQALRERAQQSLTYGLAPLGLGLGDDQDDENDNGSPWTWLGLGLSVLALGTVNVGDRVIHALTKKAFTVDAIEGNMARLRNNLGQRMTYELDELVPDPAAPPRPRVPDLGAGAGLPPMPPPPVSPPDPLMPPEPTGRRRPGWYLNPDTGARDLVHITNSRNETAGRWYEVTYDNGLSEWVSAEHVRGIDSADAPLDSSHPGRPAPFDWSYLNPAAETLTTKAAKFRDQMDPIVLMMTSASRDPRDWANILQALGTDPTSLVTGIDARGMRGIDPAQLDPSGKLYLATGTFGSQDMGAALPIVANNADRLIAMADKVRDLNEASLERTGERYAPDKFAMYAGHQFFNMGKDYYGVDDVDQSPIMRLVRGYDVFNNWVTKYIAETQLNLNPVGVWVPNAIQGAIVSAAEGISPIASTMDAQADAIKNVFGGVAGGMRAQASYLGEHATGAEFGYEGGSIFQFRTWADAIFGTPEYDDQGVITDWNDGYLGQRLSVQQLQAGRNRMIGWDANIPGATPVIGPDGIAFRDAEGRAIMGNVLSQASRAGGQNWGTNKRIDTPLGEVRFGEGAMYYNAYSQTFQDALSRGYEGMFEPVFTRLGNELDPAVVSSMRAITGEKVGRVNRNELAIALLEGTPDNPIRRSLPGPETLDDYNARRTAIAQQVLPASDDYYRVALRAAQEGAAKTMLDPAYQRNFNTWLRKISPFALFATQTAGNWATRTLTNPSTLKAVSIFNDMAWKQHQQNEEPDRYSGTIELWPGGPQIPNLAATFSGFNKAMGNPTGEMMMDQATSIQGEALALATMAGLRALPQTALALGVNPQDVANQMIPFSAAAQSTLLATTGDALLSQGQANPYRRYQAARWLGAQAAGGELDTNIALLAQQMLYDEQWGTGAKRNYPTAAREAANNAFKAVGQEQAFTAWSNLLTSVSAKAPPNPNETYAGMLAADLVNLRQIDSQAASQATQLHPGLQAWYAAKSIYPNQEQPDYAPIDRFHQQFDMPNIPRGPAPDFWQMPTFDTTSGILMTQKKNASQRRTESRNTGIYMLFDPATDEPYYVGQSVNPSERFVQHLEQLDAGNVFNHPKTLKEAEMLQQGRVPYMQVLNWYPGSTATSDDLADVNEDAWIGYLVHIKGQTANVTTPSRTDWEAGLAQLGLSIETLDARYDAIVGKTDPTLEPVRLARTPNIKLSVFPDRMAEPAAFGSEAAYYIPNDQALAYAAANQRPAGPLPGVDWDETQWGLPGVGAAKRSQLWTAGIKTWADLADLNDPNDPQRIRVGEIAGSESRANLWIAKAQTTLAQTQGYAIPADQFRPPPPAPPTPTQGLTAPGGWQFTRPTPEGAEPYQDIYGQPTGPATPTTFNLSNLLTALFAGIGAPLQTQPTGPTAPTVPEQLRTQAVPDPAALLAPMATPPPAPPTQAQFLSLATPAAIGIGSAVAAATGLSWLGAAASAAYSLYNNRGNVVAPTTTTPPAAYGPPAQRAGLPGTPPPAAQTGNYWYFPGYRPNAAPGQDFDAPSLPSGQQFWVGADMIASGDSYRDADYVNNPQFDAGNPQTSLARMTEFYGPLQPVPLQYLRTTPAYMGRGPHNTFDQQRTIRTGLGALYSDPYGVNGAGGMLQTQGAPDPRTQPELYQRWVEEVYKPRGEYGIWLDSPIKGAPTYNFQQTGQTGLTWETKPRTPVSAAAPGQVIFADSTADQGYMVIVQHDFGQTIYNNLAGAAVTPGQMLATGDMIGLSTQNFSFGFRLAGDERGYSDPTRYLPSQGERGASGWALTDIPGVNAQMATILVDMGYRTPEELLARGTPAALDQHPLLGGAIDAQTGWNIIGATQALLQSGANPNPPLTAAQAATAPSQRTAVSGASTNLAPSQQTRAGIAPAVSAFAAKNNVDPALLQAVMNVEAGGRTHDATTGQAIARLEVHVFRDTSGIDAATFNQNFQVIDAYTANYKDPATGKWLPVHGSQANEQAAIALAASLTDRDKALYATSQGGAQILGMHATGLGYTGPAAMYDAFTADAQNQYAGYFTFLANSGLLANLQAGDIEGFVAGYNPGVVASYTANIRSQRDQLNATATPQATTTQAATRAITTPLGATGTLTDNNLDQLRAGIIPGLTALRIEHLVTRTSIRDIGDLAKLDASRTAAGEPSADATWLAKQMGADVATAESILLAADTWRQPGPTTRPATVGYLFATSNNSEITGDNLSAANLEAIARAGAGNLRDLAAYDPYDLAPRANLSYAQARNAVRTASTTLAAQGITVAPNSRTEQRTYAEIPAPSRDQGDPTPLTANLFPGLTQNRIDILKNIDITTVGQLQQIGAARSPNRNEWLEVKTGRKIDTAIATELGAAARAWSPITMASPLGEDRISKALGLDPKERYALEQMGVTTIGALTATQPRWLDDRDRAAGYEYATFSRQEATTLVEKAARLANLDPDAIITAGSRTEPRYEFDAIKNVTYERQQWLYRTTTAPGSKEYIDTAEEFLAADPEYLNRASDDKWDVEAIKKAQAALSVQLGRPVAVKQAATGSAPPTNFTTLPGIDTQKAKVLNETLSLNNNFTALLAKQDEEIMTALGYSKAQVQALKAAAAAQLKAAPAPAAPTSSLPSAAPALALYGAQAGFLGVDPKELANLTPAEVDKKVNDKLSTYDQKQMGYGVADANLAQFRQQYQMSEPMTRTAQRTQELSDRRNIRTQETPRGPDINRIVRNTVAGMEDQLAAKVFKQLQRSLI